MQKAHDATKNGYWKNYPNVDTPIIAEQLNRNESTVDVIDDRVVAFDTTKANQTDMLVAIRNIQFNDQTGIFTFTRFNGTTFQIDTDLEKIVTNFDYDDDPESAHYQQLIITLIDGTVKYVDMSALITQYEFTDTATIRFSIGNNGKVSANIIDGSITGAKLQPNYLADITAQAQIATQAATSSTNSATASQSWAEGGTHTREDEDIRNAKYYSEVAADKVSELLTNFGIEYLNGRIIFGTTFEQLYNIEVVGTRLIFSEVS